MCVFSVDRVCERIVKKRWDIVNNILADWHYQFERCLKVILSFNIDIYEWCIEKNSELMSQKTRVFVWLVIWLDLAVGLNNVTTFLSSRFFFVKWGAWIRLTLKFFSFYKIASYINVWFPKEQMGKIENK